VTEGPWQLGLEPVSTDIRTCLCSRAGIPAWKGFGQARDRGDIFGETTPFRPAETALSRVSGSKAAKSQRPFRPRLETGIARDCVVEHVGLEPATKRLWMADVTDGATGWRLSRGDYAVFRPIPA
jgi:hypothetical protein